MRMKLVEVPDHAGLAALPHAPKQLRMLLAEGRDAQNDETAQSEKARKQNVFPLELIILNPRIQILPVGCFFTRLEGLFF
jgi:hypothetical protein